MASGPSFAPADAVPARGGDLLDVVAGLDRQINQLSALRALALDLARKEHLARAAGQAATRADAEVSSVARFDSTVLAQRSFRAEVAALLTISERAAENLIAVSGVLASALPATTAALGRGDISWRHATIMVDETAGLDPAPMAGLEQKVLESAERLTPPKFARMLRKTREQLHPETIVARHTTALDERGVTLDDDRDGMSSLTIRAGSVHLHAILNRLTTAARALNGPLEERTLDQRRADILTHVLLAHVDGEAFGVVPDQWDDENFVHWYRGITAEVTITVPVLTLLGHNNTPATLDGWVPIDPVTARRLTAGAKSFLRILTHPRNRGRALRRTHPLHSPPRPPKTPPNPRPHLPIPRLQHARRTQRHRPHPRLGARRRNRPHQPRPPLPQPPHPQRQHPLESHPNRRRLRSAHLDHPHRTHLPHPPPNPHPHPGTRNRLRPHEDTRRPVHRTATRAGAIPNALRQTARLFPKHRKNGIGA